MSENKERKTPITFEQFRQASEVFGNDYAIVGHAGEPVVRYGQELRPHGKYSVTGLAGMNEGEFKDLLSGINVVLAICMDKRGAKESVEEARRIAMSKGISEPSILVFAQGGGIIGRDEVVQGGKTVSVGRGDALRTMFGYVYENAQGVKLVIATGHDCRCGAEAFANDGIGIPEMLNCERGSVEEQREMMSRIREHSRKIIPQAWHNITENYLVHFPGDESGDIDFKRA